MFLRGKNHNESPIPYILCVHAYTHTYARTRESKTAHCGARPALFLNISSERECLQSKSCGTRTPERAVDGEKRCKDKHPESAQRKNDRGDGEWCSGKHAPARLLLTSHARSKSCTRTPERAVDGEEWRKDKRSERARTGAYSLYVTGRASSVEPYLRRYASPKVFSFF